MQINSGILESTTDFDSKGRALILFTISLYLHITSPKGFQFDTNVKFLNLNVSKRKRSCFLLEGFQSVLLLMEAKDYTA